MTTVPAVIAAVLVVAAAVVAARPVVAAADVVAAKLVGAAAVVVLAAVVVAAAGATETGVVVANVVAVFGAAAAIAWASCCKKDDVVVEAAEFEPPLVVAAVLDELGEVAVAVEVPAAGVAVAGVVVAVWGTAEVEDAGEAAVAELVSDALVVGDGVDVLEGAVAATEVRCTARDDVVAEAEEAELARAETECPSGLEPEEPIELVEPADLAAFDCFESVAFRVELVLVCFDDEVLL